MSKHKTPMDWIYDHSPIIVSFEPTIDSVSYDPYEFEALTIRMKIPLYKTITERHIEYTPADDVLIDTLDEMYKDLLLASLSH
jgi:hypothetical protein